MQTNTMNSMLLDSSFVFAVYSMGDRNHPDAAAFTRNNTAQMLIPDVVLPEVAFLFNRAYGLNGVVDFLKALEVAQPHLEPLLPGDLRRIREIMAAYPEARLDFVDCCVIALAERLDIDRICTYDRRDFSIIRPAHRDYLTLLP
jgi:predicted nucleic acid-binding protein